MTSPWDDHQSRQPAPDEQAAAYQAVLQTFSGQPWWAGVFWWDWDVAHLYDVDTASALDYSIRGKPAESVLRRWWRAAQSSQSSAQAMSPIGPTRRCLYSAPCAWAASSTTTSP